MKQIAKKKADKHEFRHRVFDKLAFPILEVVTKNQLSFTERLMSVQPMGSPMGHVLHMDFVTPRPTRIVRCRRCKYWRLLPPSCRQEMVRGPLSMHYEAVRGYDQGVAARAALDSWQQDNAKCEFAYYNDIRMLSGRCEYVAIRRGKIMSSYLIALS